MSHVFSTFRQTDIYAGAKVLGGTREVIQGKCSKQNSPEVILLFSTAADAWCTNKHHHFGVKEGDFKENFLYISLTFPLRIRRHDIYSHALSLSVHGRGKWPIEWVAEPSG